MFAIKLRNFFLKYNRLVKSLKDYIQLKKHKSKILTNRLRMARTDYMNELREHKTAHGAKTLNKLVDFDWKLADRFVFLYLHRCQQIACMKNLKL
jgi:hypothetical protein